MSQVSLRVDLIAHPLLQFFGFGKTTVQLALPYLYPVAGDMKGATASRHQRYLAEVIAKCGQEFLRQPGRAQQPLALRAIADDDFRLEIGHDKALGRLMGRL